MENEKESQLPVVSANSGTLMGGIDPHSYLNRTAITHTGKIMSFRDFRKYSPIFIETGASMGGGIVQAIEAEYQIVKSVEAKDDYFQHCVNNFHTDSRVSLYHGLSKDNLEKMLSDVKEPAVFWLDAHVSGSNSAGYEDWLEKGEESDYAQHKALMAELSIVLKHRNDHVVLVDDQNGVHETTKIYIDMFLSVNPKYKFYFYDEQRDPREGARYKDKILVAIPETQ